MGQRTPPPPRRFSATPHPIPQPGWRSLGDEGLLAALDRAVARERSHGATRAGARVVAMPARRG